MFSNSGNIGLKTGACLADRGSKYQRLSERLVHRFFSIDCVNVGGAFIQLVEHIEFG